MTTAGCTCYLGHPDDPNADPEACDACDRAFWSNPVYRLADEPEESHPVTVNHASNLHPNRASSACGLAAADLDGHANLLAATTTWPEDWPT